MPLFSAVRILLIVLTLLLVFTDPVASVTSATIAQGPGFWEGILEGFLCLPKLMASPFADVTLVDPSDHPFGYNIGFYAGVLLFAGGGAAASSSTPESVSTEVANSGKP